MHFINVVCLVSLLSATNPSGTISLPDHPVPLASKPSDFSIHAEERDVFEPVHETVYLLEDAVLSVQPTEDAGSIRSVKKYDEILLVAANLSVHPRGSLVETSLGTGIVCDTGGFAAGNPTQLDVATAW